jgi:hypothetical protein
MNTKNTASQPNVVSIGDDAQFQALLDRFFITSNWGSTQIRAEIVAHLDSKLRAPADQAASVAREYYFRADACKAKVPTDTDCICWHAEGTGPMANYPAGIGTWRNASPQQSLAPAADKIEIPSNEEFDKLYESHVGHPADFAADVLERWGGWPMGILGQGGSGVLPVAAEGQVSAAAPTFDRAEFIRRAVLAVAEIPDRDSPEDQPEMMLVTGDELRGILASGFELASEGQAQTSEAAGDFERGVIAALGVMTAHGYPHGSTYHDEIVSSVGEESIYAVAEDEDYAWAGLDPAKKPGAAQLADSTGGVKS